MLFIVNKTFVFQPEVIDAANKTEPVTPIGKTLFYGWIGWFELGNYDKFYFTFEFKYWM